MFKRHIVLTVIIAFFVSNLTFSTPLQAQGLLGLPEPGTMVGLSQAYSPAMLRGLTVHNDNPFLFDFIVDPGQEKMSADQIKAEGDKLVKYFLATVAIPAQDLWVNLSPYEKDRVIPEALGQTDMGRDLLAQDYLLKQITASLIYPEKELGKKFWDRVYQKTQAQFGTNNIPVNTFNKVWIMSDKAEIYEQGQTAFVTKSHLKVMLEEDYLAFDRNRHQSGEMQLHVQSTQGNSRTGTQSSQVIRDVILPELEREVNTGENFADLRQIFNAIILAAWYKNNLKGTVLNQAYADQQKVKGIDIEDKTIKERIYQRYLQAYKKGVFNYIKEDDSTGSVMPRKYFSGGVDTRVRIDRASVAQAAAFVSTIPSGMMRITVDAVIRHGGSSASASDAIFNASENALYQQLKDDVGYQASASAILPAIEMLQQDLIARRITNGPDGFQHIQLTRLEKAYAGRMEDEGHLIRNNLRRFLAGPGGRIPIKTMGLRDFDFGWSNQLNAEDILRKAQEWLRVMRVVALEGIAKTVENKTVKEQFILNRMGLIQADATKVEFYKNQLDTLRAEMRILSEQLKEGRDQAMNARDRILWFRYAPESSRALTAQEMRAKEFVQRSIPVEQITPELIDYLEKFKAKFDLDAKFRLDTGTEAEASRGTVYYHVDVDDFPKSSVAIQPIFEEVVKQLLQNTIQDATFTQGDRSLKIRFLYGTRNTSDDVNTQRLLLLYKKDTYLYLDTMIKALKEIASKTLIATSLSGQEDVLRRNLLRLMGSNEPAAKEAYKVLVSGIWSGEFEVSDDIRLTLEAYQLLDADRELPVVLAKVVRSVMFKDRDTDPAMAAMRKATNGGIDLKDSGANTFVSKDGAGVEFQVDPALIERVKREGIESLTPVILRIQPIVNIWPLLGLKAPKEATEHLAGL